MAKEIIFSGDELEFLMALDRGGCVLTDDGKFYCDLENEKIAMRSRLPVRIKGEYESCENGWRIRYRVAPAPKTAMIALIFAVLFAASLVSFAAAGGSLTGSALFAILCGAMAVNYSVQYKSCEKRFRNLLQ